jgi:hypothetical protein
MRIKDWLIKWKWHGLQMANRRQVSAVSLWKELAELVQQYRNVMFSWPDKRIDMAAIICHAACSGDRKDSDLTTLRVRSS